MSGLVLTLTHNKKKRPVKTKRFLEKLKSDVFVPQLNLVAGGVCALSFEAKSKCQTALGGWIPKSFQCISERLVHQLTASQ